MNYKIPLKTGTTNKESKVDRIVSSPAISLGISARVPFSWYRKIQRRKPGQSTTRVVPQQYEIPEATSKGLLSSRNVLIEKVTQEYIRADSPQETFEMEKDVIDEILNNYNIKQDIEPP